MSINADQYNSKQNKQLEGNKINSNA